MKKAEFIKIIFPVCEYYVRTLSESAITLYFEAAKDIDAKAFEHLVKMHLGDPDQGKFFPTLAHIAAQASSESDVKRQAALEFDSNPKIDGTPAFDLQKESKDQREARRRNFIASVTDDWKDASMLERIAYSEKVPEVLKGEMLMKLSHDAINALEAPNG
tara:strand:- start:28582 stop:29061 length:480 start_codon:yes stop_codon:yes gene_type:complete